MKLVFPLSRLASVCRFIPVSSASWMMLMFFLVISTRTSVVKSTDVAPPFATVSVYNDANRTIMSSYTDNVKRILSSVSVYGTIVCMPRGTQNSEDIDRAIALILKERAEFLGKSERALALETSVSRWRVNDVFTMKRPILVNELEELADALGLVGSSVMREAERSLKEQADELEAQSNVLRFPATSRQENQREADAMLAEQRYAASQLQDGEEDAPQYPEWD